LNGIAFESDICSLDGKNWMRLRKTTQFLNKLFKIKLYWSKKYKIGQ